MPKLIRTRSNRVQLTVCVIGTDGSGKTTLTEELASSFPDRSGVRFWFGAESVLMRPVRAFLRILWKGWRDDDSDKVGYAKEVSEKQELSRRLRWLHKPYLWLLLTDYSIQYWAKKLLVRKKDLLVFDRCFFDVAVNAAISLGWTPDELSAFVHRHCHRFTFSPVRIFLRVPPDVSISRKDDIPDKSYLELRMGYYERLSRDFAFTVLDGTEPIAKNLEIAIGLIRASESHLHIHYVHSNNTDIGGADYCFFRMAREIAQRGSLVTASLRMPNVFTDPLARAGVPVLVYPYCRPQLSRGISSLAWFPFSGLRSLYYFIRLFQSIRPSIVHVNDLYDFIPALAANVLGIPVVYHLRMIRERDLEKRMFSWVVSRSAAASVSVSEAVRDAYFPKQQRVPFRHRPEVIYDWPNDAFVEMDSEEVPEEFERFRARVIMVGRIEPWKGQRVFVEAVSSLCPRPEGVGFFLIGGIVLGSEKEKYASEVLRSAERAGIVWLGERRDVKRFMQWADISIHASTSPDPFPGVVLESLLSESATIAANAGGVVEMIDSGTDGILIEPGDPAALARALEMLLDEKPIRDRLAKSGRQRVLRLFRKEDILDQMEALYRTLCEPGNGSGESASR